MGLDPEHLPVSPDDVRRVKTDRRLLEAVIEALGRPMYGAGARMSGRACRCPFHRDTHPSAGIHTGRGGERDWLFTCQACDWNDLNPNRPCGSGDVIAVVRVAARQSGRDIGFQEACRWLLANRPLDLGARSGVADSTDDAETPRGPNLADLNHIRSEMPIAQARLLGSAELLERLWQTRAVTPPIAARFGLGFCPDEPGGDYWAFPLHGPDGNLAAVKLHAAGAASPKSWWFPAGAKPAEPLYPVDVQPAGPVWLVAGELKALAVISVGLAAISVMSGEHTLRVPEIAVQLLRSRAVALVPDHDEVGYRWALAVARQLVAAGIEVRIADLGLTTPGSDIGDWLVERRVGQGMSEEMARAELLAAFERARVSGPVSSGMAEGGSDGHG